MLELRFNFEKEWAAPGWSIRSKAFYRALNRLYQKHFPVPGNPVDELFSYITQEDIQMLSLVERQTGRKKKHHKSDLLR